MIAHALLALYLGLIAGLLAMRGDGGPAILMAIAALLQAACAWRDWVRG